MIERGIVISPPFEVLPKGGIFCGGGIDSLELRKHLLYFDKIDYPDNNIISIGSSPDETYLESTGILRRSRVNFTGTINSGNGEFFIAAQEAIYSKNSNIEPGQWSLGQSSINPHFSNGITSQGIEFNLVNMLPVPQGIVPLEDILEFKQKRKDELIALRTHLDDVYQIIIGSADIPRSMTTEIQKLETSLKEVNKTLSEASISKIVTNLRSYIGGNFPSTFGTALGGAGVSSLIGMSPLIAAVASAGLVLTIKPILSPRNSGVINPYNYLRSMRHHLGSK
mgnify:CR=1 FL=1